MHLDLQSMINYITIGILVIFLAVAIFSIVTNKMIMLRKKKEEERLRKLPPKQFYTSSKVYTFSVPENLSEPSPSKKTIEHVAKPVERFQVLNDTLNQNAPSFTYRHWN
ncbi:MAG: hypothetical protein WC209_05335 [Ignavibacteriaceae bacterium]|jgi:hypothetical protein